MPSVELFPNKLLHLHNNRNIRIAQSVSNIAWMSIVFILNNIIEGLRGDLYSTATRQTGDYPQTWRNDRPNQPQPPIQHAAKDLKDGRENG